MEKKENVKIIKLNLTEKEINLILTGLGEIQAKYSFDLITIIKKETIKQLLNND